MICAGLIQYLCINQNINNMIAGRLNDTNTRQNTDRIVEAINNK